MVDTLFHSVDLICYNFMPKEVSIFRSSQQHSSTYVPNFCNNRDN